MALNRDKYNIEVRNDDAIKRNKILFDFMQQTFNSQDGLYLNEKSLLIYTIIKDQSRKQSEAKVERRNIKIQKQKKGR